MLYPNDNNRDCLVGQLTIEWHSKLLFDKDVEVTVWVIHMLILEERVQNFPHNKNFCKRFTEHNPNI